MAHIIIVDDNATGIKVLGEMLNVMGISHTDVQDPTKLVDIISTLEEIDAIFLDLEMPKINGYEMLKILKEQVGLTAPVVAYSVHTSEIGVARGLGFDGFIGKPVHWERFPKQLERILNGEKVWEVM